MSISTVIISKNEAKYISKCIQSVLDFSDEVIIVDDYSEDDTTSIAVSFPKVKLYQRPFDNYITQKNYANSLALGTHIFSIDADEWCSESLIQKMTSLSTSLPDAIELKRINIFCGQMIHYGLWGNDRKIRFWKKELAKWGGTTPHESLIFSKKAMIEKWDVVFYHNTYDAHIQYLEKSLKYAKLAAVELSHKSSLKLMLSSCINPFFKSFKDLIVKRGVLNGINGLFITFVAFIETFFKYFYALLIKWKIV